MTGWIDSRPFRNFFWHIRENWPAYIGISAGLVVAYLFITRVPGELKGMKDHDLLVMIGWLTILNFVFSCWRK